MSDKTKFDHLSVLARFEAEAAGYLRAAAMRSMAANDYAAINARMKELSGQEYQKPQAEKVEVIAKDLVCNGRVFCFFPKSRFCERLGRCCWNGGQYDKNKLSEECRANGV